VSRTSWMWKGLAGSILGIGFLTTPCHSQSSPTQAGWLQPTQHSSVFERLFPGPIGGLTPSSHCGSDPRASSSSEIFGEQEIGLRRPEEWSDSCVRLMVLYGVGSGAVTLATLWFLNRLNGGVSPLEFALATTLAAAAGAGVAGVICWVGNHVRVDGQRKPGVVRSLALRAPPGVSITLFRVPVR